MDMQKTAKTHVFLGPAAGVVKLFCFAEGGTNALRAGHGQLGPTPLAGLCGIHGYPLFGHTCSSSFFGVISFWGHLSSSSIVSVSAGLPACFVDVLVINLVILAAVVSSSNCFFYGFLYFEFPYLHPRIFCFWHVFANIPPSPTRPPSTRPHSHSIVCLD